MILKIFSGARYPDPYFLRWRISPYILKVTMYNDSTAKYSVNVISTTKFLSSSPIVKTMGVLKCS